MRTEHVWIECGDIRLYGEIHIPDSTPSPAVLVCHGMDAQGFHYLKFYDRFAEEICKKGLVSLLFDFRGVGRSTGTFDYGFREQQDVRCALDWLSSRKVVQPNRVFVVGHSLGGAVSLRAIKGDERVAGLVLWSVPKNHDYNVKKFIMRTRGKMGLYAFLILARIDRIIKISRIFKMQIYGINLRPKSVLAKLMKLDETEDVANLKDLPILIVVGREDDIVGVDEAEAVYSAAREPKTLLVIENADHNFRGKEDELIGTTIEWLEKRRK